MYGSFPALLPFWNASWKSCSLRVFSTLNFCLDHLSYVKSAAFIFIFNQRMEKSRRGLSQVSRVDEGWQSCCFWSKIFQWKRKCKTVLLISYQDYGLKFGSDMLQTNSAIRICWVLWSLWAFLYICHLHWMSDCPWTYSSCFLPGTLI